MKSHHVRWSATAAGLSVLLLLAFGAGAARALVVPVVVGQSQAEAVFAEPLPGATENTGTSGDNGIHSHLLGLIRNTPPGAEIRAAIHSIDRVEIADALLERSRNGVSVQIVYPQNKRGSTAAGRLAELGDKTGKPSWGSWVHWCDHNILSQELYGDGCISTHVGRKIVDGGDGGGTMHAKFFLFSATGPGVPRKWVTWLSSANLTASTGTDTWNDGLTIYENPALYSAFRDQLFTRMKNQASFGSNDFYDQGSGRGYFSVPSAGLEVHASPEQNTDLVISQTAGMSTGAACSVLVATAIFTRLDVAHRLAAMKRAGCQVLVLVGMDSPAPTLAELGRCGGKAHLGDDMDVFNALNDARIPIRKKKIHDKLVLLSAPGMTSTVLTGSHNLTASALRHNDEILVEVASPTAYDAFAGHWWRAWAEGGCNVTSYYPSS